VTSAPEHGKRLKAVHFAVNEREFNISVRNDCRLARLLNLLVFDPFS
jgi:hypothetical protein